MPEDIQSFMPHLAGLVILGELVRPEPFNHFFSLDFYLKKNLISGFIPDNSELLRDLLQLAPTYSGGIDRKRERAISCSIRGPLNSGDDLKAVTAPREFLWDLSLGETPDELYDLVVWDFGVSYRLMRAFRKSGCCLRTVPPTTDVHDIVALHPDGVVIAGGPLNGSILSKIAGNLESLIGIRPVLGVGNGAIALASALGMRIESLRDSHFGSDIPIENCRTNEITSSYQSHAYSVSPGSIKDGSEITYINVCDDTIEGFANAEYKAMGSFYSSSDDSTPTFINQYLSLLSEPVSIHNK